MAFDLDRMIQATVDAAVQARGTDSQPLKRSEKGKRKGLTVPRAFLIGAGAVTAGRLFMGSRSHELLENLQQRLIDYEERHFGGEDDEEPEAEYDDEEPEAEYDDEEPEAEEDGDFEDEEPAEERPRRRARSGSGSGRRRVRS